MPQLVTWLILTLVLALILSKYPVEADTQHAIFKHDDFPNKCVVNGPEGKQLVINYDNFARYPGKCAEIYCGLKSWALVYSCDQEYPPNGCEFGEHINFDAPFPDCCPRHIKCNNI